MKSNLSTLTNVCLDEESLSQDPNLITVSDIKRYHSHYVQIKKYDTT